MIHITYIDIPTRCTCRVRIEARSKRRLWGRRETCRARTCSQARRACEACIFEVIPQAHQLLRKNRRNIDGKSSKIVSKGWKIPKKSLLGSFVRFGLIWGSSTRRRFTDAVSRSKATRRSPRMLSRRFQSVAERVFCMFVSPGRFCSSSRFAACASLYSCNWSEDSEPLLELLWTARALASESFKSGLGKSFGDFANRGPTAHWGRKSAEQSACGSAGACENWKMGSNRWFERRKCASGKSGGM